MCFERQQRRGRCGRERLGRPPSPRKRTEVSLRQVNKGGSLVGAPEGCLWKRS